MNFEMQQTIESRSQPATRRRQRLRVLLVGNYLNDGQVSMSRFADALRFGLSKTGVDVRMVQPTPWVGRLKEGGKGLGKWLGYFDKFLVFPFVLCRTVTRLRSEGPGVAVPTLVHICDHSNAPYIWLLARLPTLVTCHDLFAIRSALGEIPNHRTSWSGRILQKMIFQGLRRTRTVACVSRATQSDFLRLLPSHDRDVKIVHNGLNYPYAPMEQEMARRTVDEVMKRAGYPAAARSSYILHVGGNHWYKNRQGVLRIIAAMARQQPEMFPVLILIGKPLTSAMIEFLDRHPDLSGKVFALGDVGNEELRAFYSAAELLIFPSLAEGFGWPIAEAQACGCPVVTTRKAPMSEVGGEAAAYLEAGDVHSCAAGDAAAAGRLACVVQDVLTEDGESRQGRRSAGLENASRFSAEGMIRAYVDLYHQVAAEL